MLQSHGGSINISTGGGGYLRAGTSTNHVDASGINVGSYGIAMNGNSISNVGNMTIDTLSARGNNIFCSNAFTIGGDLFAGSTDEFYRGRNGLTMYVRRTDAAGNDNGYYTIQVNRGIIHNVVAHG